MAIKRILVGLDGSQRAPAVLAAAVELAQLANAKLVVFRAVGLPPELPHELFELTDRRVEEVLLRNAEEDLRRLTAEVPPERIERLATMLATGWDGICRAAREHEVDMVVIGSHGYGTLDRLLGTTAAKVVNHADRNVLVVRSQAR